MFFVEKNRFPDDPQKHFGNSARYQKALVLCSKVVLPRFMSLFMDGQLRGRVQVSGMGQGLLCLA